MSHLKADCVHWLGQAHVEHLSIGWNPRAHLNYSCAYDCLVVWGLRRQVFLFLVLNLQRFPIFYSFESFFIKCNLPCNSFFFPFTEAGQRE